MEKELGHPAKADGPSPTVEPVPVSPVPASVPDAELSDLLAKFAASQEPLGAEFEKILNDNIAELYED